MFDVPDHYSKREFARPELKIEKLEILEFEPELESVSRQPKLSILHFIIWTQTQNL